MNFYDFEIIQVNIFEIPLKQINESIAFDSELHLIKFKTMCAWVYVCVCVRFCNIYLCFTYRSQWNKYNQLFLWTTVGQSRLDFSILFQFKIACICYLLFFIWILIRMQMVIVLPLSACINKIARVEIPF